MLTQSQIDTYWEKGWLVVDGVFSREAIVAVRDRADTVAQELIDGTPHRADRDEAGNMAPRKIDAPFKRDPLFREFVLDATLKGLLTQLLVEEPLLATDQIFMKPPRFGSAKPYHQDNYYFRCTPRDKVLTAWIALDDVDEANGCLRYIDVSHREGILPHTPVPGEPHNLAIAPEKVDLARESLAIVKLGGVVFHHSETMHTSHRNTSDRWRRAYASHWVTRDVTSTSGVIGNAHYHQYAPVADTPISP